MAKKIKLRMGTARVLKKKARRNSFSSKKHCRFCGNSENLANIDYKNSLFLKNFISERGKILPSRISGNCSKHQRILSKEIKKSRTVALLPYCYSHS